MNNNEASNEKVNGDMALESEELEQDDVQLATDELAEVVGGGCAQEDPAQGPGGYYSWTRAQQERYNDQQFSAAISTQPKPISG